MELKLDNGKIINFEKEIKIIDIINDNYKEVKDKIILARFNKKYYELSRTINSEGFFEVTYIDTYIGRKTYERTMQFIFYVACNMVLKGAKVYISHAISGDIYGEVSKSDGTKLNEDDIAKIKVKMIELMDEGSPIERSSIPKEEAIKIFEDYEMEDKVRILKSIENVNVSVYCLKGYYNYFYGEMASETSLSKVFDIILYGDGFILRYSKNKDTNELAKFKPLPKLSAIFNETKEWNKILEVNDVGELNEAIRNGKLIDLIRAQEAFHEKKIAYIADDIKNRGEVKIVFIAGPTSSGKTTFARRLSVQLTANGLKPYLISLDDYFRDRILAPIGEDGKPDLESIENVDITQFDEDMSKIIKGERVLIPEYNFITGKREYHNNYIEIPKNGVVIVEGIHCLNRELIGSLKCEIKNIFRIYISALTQLNLDNQNRISTTDVRMIRRIVRDNLSRDIDVAKTLDMIASVRHGEEKNIFVFQEDADIMFNSALIYELVILRNIALKELEKIDKSSDVYYDASRLKKFLKFFESFDDFGIVPDNSILREFIGGSSFYKY